MARSISRRTVPLLIAFLSLAAVGGFAIVGVVKDESGRAELRGVLERHAAGGWGASYRDLVTSAPPVDADRQDRAWAWMRKTDGAPPTSARSGDVTWFLDGEAAPSPEVQEAHEGFRPDAEALGDLLAEGPLCLTSLGWMQHDASTADEAPLAERVGGHIPNLLRLRAAYRWWGTEALLRADPTEALETLDRLHAALARPGCLIDAMIAIACDDMRDETFLVLALGGRLGDDRLAAWLDEPSRGAGLVADGWRGERLRFCAPLARDLVAGRSMAASLGGEDAWDEPSGLWSWHVRPFFVGAAECATHLEGLLAFERYVRGDVTADEARRALDACAGLGAPFDLMMPNAGAMLTSLVYRNSQRRAVRVAAALATTARHRSGPPASEADARAWLGTKGSLFDARPFALGIEYERPAEDRFRLRFDPASPLPALLDAAPALLLDPSREPAPASDRPLDRRGGRIEVRVP